MRIRLALLFQILLATCLAPALAQSDAGTGTKTLYIQFFPTRADDPVRIRVMDGATELKSDGRQFPGAWETAFNAGDDWISDVSFAIKNVSPRKITCINVFSVLVETPFWQNENLPKPPMLGFTQNRVGQRPEHAPYADGPGIPPDTDAPFELAPGEEFTMPIEDPRDYPELKERIEKKLPISNVTAMDGGNVTVFFEDGTKWSHHSYRRPAEQPGEWTRISYQEWVGQPKSSEQ